MTYDLAKVTCDQAIAIGKALGLKFDERFPPQKGEIERAFNKLVKENTSLKERIKTYNMDIEEYKVKKADGYRQVWLDGGARPETYQAFEDGFQDCLNLDLPVLFREWCDHSTVTITKYEGKTPVDYYYIVKQNPPRTPYLLKAVYEHWVNNIYRLENNLLDKK